IHPGTGAARRGAAPGAQGSDGGPGEGPGLGAEDAQVCGVRDAQPAHGVVLRALRGGAGGVVGGGAVRRLVERRGGEDPSGSPPPRSNRLTVEPPYFFLAAASFASRLLVRLAAFRCTRFFRPARSSSLA